MSCKDCIHYIVCEFYDSQHPECADGCKYVEYRKEGHWIPWDSGCVICSECRGVSLSPTTYCPDCGARMKRLNYYANEWNDTIDKGKYSSPDTSNERFNGEYRNTWNED